MKRTRLRPFLSKLFRTFILMAGIPIISISVLNNLLVTQMYTAELGKSYQEKLQIADTILKMWEDEIRKQAFVISMNEYLNSPKIGNIHSGDIPEYDYINTIKGLSSFLENIVSTNNKYHSIAVLYENSEFLVRSNYGLAPDESGYSYADYAELCAEGSSWMIRKPPEFSGQEEPEIELVYVIPLLKYVSRHRGFILFHVRENELSASINSGISGNNPEVFILDKEGMVLSDTNKDRLGKNLRNIPEVESFLQNTKTSDFFPAKINEIRYFLVYLRSTSNNWIYCSFVPNEELNKRTTFIFMATIITIVFFLILTVCFSYASAKNLNKPVEKLEGRMEDYYLIQMLSGVKNKDPPSVSVKFPFPNFCCVIICLDDYNAIAEKQNEEYIEDNKMNILKICRKKLTPFVHCSGIFMEPNSVVLILNFNGSNLDFLPGILEEIQKEILTLFTYSISIGIGKIYSKSEGHLAYSTARGALSRRLILGPGSLIQYRQEEASKGYFYPYDKEEIIFNHLRSHSHEAIAGTTREFFRTIKDEKDISVDNVIQACNQLLGGIIKYLVILGISSREIFHDESNLYLRLSRFEFLEETEKFFTEILKKIIQMESIIGIQQESPIDRIMHYIRTNYDKPFDLNKLADEVNMSYSHVRRVFTAEMNESILSYVYKMKVQFSKKLLKETEMPVSEISEKLGFYNRQSFYHFFKKFEGVTPNKYRGIAE